MEKKKHKRGKSWSDGLFSKTNGIFTRKKPPGNIFHKPLKEVIDWQNQNGEDTSIPYIVTETIDWLRKNGAVKEEGLFRLSGQSDLITKFKERYHKKGSVDLSGYDQLHIHSISGVLKLYLRELPEPLFIFRFYSTFLRVAKNNDDAQRIQHIFMLLKGLPKENFSTIMYLIQFLSEIAQNEPINKMSSMNLALIFGPNLFRNTNDITKDDPLAMLSDGQYITRVIEQIIDEFPYISGKTDRPSCLSPDSCFASSDSIPTLHLLLSGSDTSEETPITLQVDSNLVDSKTEEQTDHKAVKKWLGTYGLEKYCDSFVQAGYVNMSTIHNLTEKNLEDLGVDVGHRKTLLVSVARLQEKQKTKKIRFAVPGEAPESGEDTEQRKSF